MTRRTAAVHAWLLALLLAAAQAPGQTAATWSASSKAAKVKPGGTFKVEVTAKIENGWHLYSIAQPPPPVATKISLPAGQPFTLDGRVEGPAARVTFDQNFGINTELYDGSALFTVPVKAATEAPAGRQTIKVEARYQACNDQMCLPPKTVPLTLEVEVSGKSEGTSRPSGAAAGPSGTAAGPSGTAAGPSGTAAGPSGTVARPSGAAAGPSGAAAGPSGAAARPSGTAARPSGAAAGPSGAAARPSGTAARPSGTPTDRPTQTDKKVQSDTSLQTESSSQTDRSLPTTTALPIGGRSLWSFVWLAMSVGALSLLTPCVFPMVPITVSYFTNHAAGSRRKAVQQAGTYMVGIILTFTALGMALALLVGATSLNRFAANPWVNLLITAIFIGFALSLFGVFDLEIPPSLVNRLDALTRRQGGSQTLATVLMGLTFTLTSFTCTAPFIGTLLVMAAGGNWQWPLVGMLAFSTVFALPFFVLALMPQWIARLPRSGGWLNSVKVMMAFLEVAAAMKFISNVDLVWGWGIFTRDVVLATWVVLGVLMALYVIGLFRFKHDAPVQHVGLVRLATAVLCGTLAVWLLTGLFGKRLGEIEAFLPPAAETTVEARSMGGELPWIMNDFQGALARARQEQKHVFVDFTGYTCTNCRWMEANMFTRPEVQRELRDYILVRLYTDGEGEMYERQQQLQQAMYQTVALPFYAVLDAEGRRVADFPGLTRDPAQFVQFLKQAQRPAASGPRT
jgi:thiol:disulfide interchange protein DsbD